MEEILGDGIETFLAEYITRLESKPNWWEGFFTNFDLLKDIAGNAVKGLMPNESFREWMVWLQENSRHYSCEELNRRALPFTYCLANYESNRS